MKHKATDLILVPYLTPNISSFKLGFLPERMDLGKLSAKLTGQEAEMQPLLHCGAPPGSSEREGKNEGARLEATFIQSGPHSSPPLPPTQVAEEASPESLRNAEENQSYRRRGRKSCR